MKTIPTSGDSVIRPLEAINIDTNWFLSRGITDSKQHFKKKTHIKNVLKCYFNYKASVESGETLRVFMLHATTSPFKCTQASEESQLISSAVCQQRGPDASQAAARGANERRRKHLPFKPGDVVLVFNTQGFVLFLPSPPLLCAQILSVRKEDSAGSKGFHSTELVCQRSFYKRRVSLMCGPKSRWLWSTVRGVHWGRWDLHDYEESLSKVLLLLFCLLCYLLFFPPDEWKLNQT